VERRTADSVVKVLKNSYEVLEFFSSLLHDPQFDKLMTDFAALLTHMQRNIPAIVAN
jgi:uncharacterized membrane protein YgaE (UPF0421/DUF939 family)